MRDLIKERKRNHREFYLNKIKKGYGQGTGPDYKPWLDIFTLPSRFSKPSSYSSVKTGRDMHFASRLEANYALIQEYNPGVADINEQYPLLDIDLTRDISHKFGYRCPLNMFSEEAYVLTSDFRLTVSDGEGRFRSVIRTVKPSGKLKKDRVCEKLLIEREYWRIKGITDWKVVTEKQIDSRLADNLRVIMNAREKAGRLFGQPHSEEFMKIRKEYAEEFLSSGNMKIFMFNRHFEKENGLGEGAGNLIFLDLAGAGDLPVNLKGDIRITRFISEVLYGISD